MLSSLKLLIFIMRLDQSMLKHMADLNSMPDLIHHKKPERIMRSFEELDYKVLCSLRMTEVNK